MIEAQGYPSPIVTKAVNSMDRTLFGFLSVFTEAREEILACLGANVA